MSPGVQIFWIVVVIILIAIAGYFSFPVRILGVLTGIFFLGAGIYVFIKYSQLWPEPIREQYTAQRSKKFTPTPRFRDQWEPIRQASHSNDLKELRVTIIDADTLVEDLLREQGLEGDTMAALISEATLQGNTGTDVIATFHSLRNRIVHDSTFVPKPEKLRELLQKLDKVLVRWGVLLPN